MNIITKYINIFLKACPDGKEKQDFLCYNPCRSGYKGVGPVCWENCRDGYVDWGAFCTKPGRIYSKRCNGLECNGDFWRLRCNWVNHG